MLGFDFIWVWYSEFGSEILQTGYMGDAWRREERPGNGEFIREEGAYPHSSSCLRVCDSFWVLILFGFVIWGLAVSVWGVGYGVWG